MYLLFRVLSCLVLICFCQQISCYEISFQETDWEHHTFLVSYPRSGNTWTRYCLEFLTKRPTIRLKNGIEIFHHVIPEKVLLDNQTKFELHLPINNNIPLGVDYSKPPILKAHFFLDEYPIEKFSKTTQAKFILLIRNPKECLLRESDIETAKHEIRTEDFGYFQNLYVYHSWNPETRKLIYYEDFIQDPINVLRDLLDFLGEDHRYLNEFMKDYELHQKRCIQHYKAMGHKSYTKGKDPLFHSQELTKQERRSIDALIKRKYPDLWETYLSRYAEN